MRELEIGWCFQLCVKPGCSRTSLPSFVLLQGKNPEMQLPWQGFLNKTTPG